MPTAPTIPPLLPGMPPSQSPQAKATPASFLMAAADLHSQGKLSTAPVPRGQPLQTGRVPRHKRSLQIVK